MVILETHQKQQNHGNPVFVIFVIFVSKSVTWYPKMPKNTIEMPKKGVKNDPKMTPFLTPYIRGLGGKNGVKRPKRGSKKGSKK